MLLGLEVVLRADTVVHGQEWLQDPAPTHILLCGDLSHHMDEETAEGILLEIVVV
jgi:hypothetical protein